MCELFDEIDPIPYMGQTTMRCPDCRANIPVSYDWHRGARFQTTRTRRFHIAKLIEHALELPLLHPTVLPNHHRTGAAR